MFQKINPYEESKKLKWKYKNWDNFKALKDLLLTKLKTDHFYSYNELHGLFDTLSSEAKVYKQSSLYLLHIKIFYGVKKETVDTAYGCRLYPISYEE